MSLYEKIKAQYSITASQSDRYKSLEVSYLKSLSDEDFAREFSLWADKYYNPIARKSYNMLKQNKLKRDGKRLNDELKARGYKDFSDLQNKLKK